MREILFRGFHKDKNGKQKVFVNGEWIRGEWVEGNYIYLHKTTYCFEGDTEHDKENEIHQIVFEQMTDWDLPNKHLKVDVIPETVGQYTGLPDKNGTKIFEGDICRKFKSGDCVSVAWHGTMAGYVWSKRKENNRYIFDFGDLFRVSDKYEVIGNIHDNPELLDGAGNG